MKTLVATLAVTGLLIANAAAGPYYYGGGYCGPYGGYGGCYYGGGCNNFWPGLAIGLGVGALTTALVSSSQHSDTVYYAVPTPVYTYNPTAVSTTAAAPPPPQPVVAKSVVWVPSTPGAGQWVPDPEPYAYFAAAPSPKPKTVVISTTVVAATVSRTSSAGGVPVYALAH